MSALFVVTRDDPRDDRMLRAAEERGSTTLRLPLLGTEAGADGERLVAWLGAPPPGAAVAWTSRRAAEALLDALRCAGPRSREVLRKVPLFAVGAESAAPMTAEGFRVEYVRDLPSARRLAELILSHRDALGLRIVAFLRGNRSLPDLPDSLRSRGLEVIGFEVYRTRFQAADTRPLVRALESGAEVTVVFYSPSGIEALESLLSPEAVGALRLNGQAVSFGVTTREALISRGYRRTACIEAVRHSPAPSATPEVQSGEEPQ